MASSFIQALNRLALEMQTVRESQRGVIAAWSIWLAATMYAILNPTPPTGYVSGGLAIAMLYLLLEWFYGYQKLPRLRRALTRAGAKLVVALVALPPALAYCETASIEQGNHAAAPVFTTAHDVALTIRVAAEPAFELGFALLVVVGVGSYLIERAVTREPERIWDKGAPCKRRPWHRN